MFGQAVRAGTAAVSDEPLRESARSALIEAHLAEHNVVAALREYNAFGLGRRRTVLFRLLLAAKRCGVRS